MGVIGPGPDQGRHPPGSPCLHTPDQGAPLSNGTMVAPSTMEQVCLGESPSWAGSLSPWMALAMDSGDLRLSHLPF